MFTFHCDALYLSQYDIITIMDQTHFQNTSFTINDRQTISSKAEHCLCFVFCGLAFMFFVHDHRPPQNIAQLVVSQIF